MPDKEIELTQHHGENQEKGLDHQPDRIKPHHPGTDPKTGFGKTQKDILDQNPDSKHQQGKPKAEQQHDYSTPIHEGHGEQNKEKLRIELKLVFHVRGPTTALIYQMLP